MNPSSLQGNKTNAHSPRSFLYLLAVDNSFQPWSTISSPAWTWHCLPVFPRSKKLRQRAGDQRSFLAGDLRLRPKGHQPSTAWGSSIRSLLQGPGTDWQCDNRAFLPPQQQAQGKSSIALVAETKYPDKNSLCMEENKCNSKHSAPQGRWGWRASRCGDESIYIREQEVALAEMSRLIFRLLLAKDKLCLQPTTLQDMQSLLEPRYTRDMLGVLQPTLCLPGLSDYLLLSVLVCDWYQLFNSPSCLLGRSKLPVGIKQDWI